MMGLSVTHCPPQLSSTAQTPAAGPRRAPAFVPARRFGLLSSLAGFVLTASKTPSLESH
ncbi:MAG: hypothetical protein ACYDD1_06075 [Caulobacteraceae bacterium]